MKATVPACAVLVLGAAHLAPANGAGATPTKISGSTALALAGAIAPLSPELSGAEKKAVAMLLPMPTFLTRSRSW